MASLAMNESLGLTFRLQLGLQALSQSQITAHVVLYNARSAQLAKGPFNGHGPSWEGIWIPISPLQQPQLAGMVLQPAILTTSHSAECNQQAHCCRCHTPIHKFLHLYNIQRFHSGAGQLYTDSTAEVINPWRSRLKLSQARRSPSWQQAD